LYFKQATGQLARVKNNWGEKKRKTRKQKKTGVMEKKGGTSNEEGKKNQGPRRLESGEVKRKDSKHERKREGFLFRTENLLTVRKDWGEVTVRLARHAVQNICGGSKIYGKGKKKKWGGTNRAKPGLKEWKKKVRGGSVPKGARMMELEPSSGLKRTWSGVLKRR